MRKLLLFFLAALAPACGYAQSGKTGREAEVRAALERFLRAFDDLDWDGFRFSFLDDATVFYPRAVPARADGREEFERQFRAVFAQIRSGRAAPPYMDLRPRGLEIQMLGDVAVATFHLDDRPGYVNRRTLVLKRAKGAWRIAHLHASEVARGTP